METLETLREKRRAYIIAEADKIVNYMLERGLTTDTDTSCGSSGWDIERHNAMPEIIRELSKRRIKTTSSVNWGVTDYVYIIVG